MYQMNSLNVLEYVDSQELEKIGQWITMLYTNYKKNQLYNTLQHVCTLIIDGGYTLR